MKHESSDLVIEKDGYTLNIQFSRQWLKDGSEPQWLVQVSREGVKVWPESTWYGYANSCPYLD